MKKTIFPHQFTTTQRWESWNVIKKLPIQIIIVL